MGEPLWFVWKTPGKTGGEEVGLAGEVKTTCWPKAGWGGGVPAQHLLDWPGAQPRCCTEHEGSPSLLPLQNSYLFCLNLNAGMLTECHVPLLFFVLSRFVLWLGGGEGELRASNCTTGINQGLSSHCMMTLTLELFLF